MSHHKNQRGVILWRFSPHRKYQKNRKYCAVPSNNAKLTNPFIRQKASSNTQTHPIILFPGHGLSFDTQTYRLESACLLSDRSLSSGANTLRHHSAKINPSNLVPVIHGTRRAVTPRSVSLLLKWSLRSAVDSAGLDWKTCPLSCECFSFA